MSEVTTEITVTCSYCNSPVTVPFRHGAVMPLKERNAGVAVFIPTLTGGDHECPSERHSRERDWWERGIGRYIPTRCTACKLAESPVCNHVAVA